MTFVSSGGNFGFYNGIVLGNRLILEPALNPTNLTLTVQPAVTTTTLAAPPSPSVSGQSVTFTAAVTVALPPTTIDPVPTGTVTFYADGNAIGTGTLSVLNGLDQASLTIATLSTSSHQITAAYTSGDTNFIPSPASTPQTQVVNKANTSATVASSAAQSVFGQAVTFTATVSVAGPGSTAVASPTGTITFYDNGTAIGTGTLNAVGGQDVATLTTSSLSTATHPIPAAYTSGDGNFNASPTSAAISQVVNKDSTTTTASASPGFASVGQAVTFTATLTYQGSVSLSGNSSSKISQGIYSKISLSGNATLTMNGGTYIIEGGGLSVSGNAIVSGSGVLIVNAGSDYPSTGGSYGSITLSGNGSYSLTPMTTGSYAGIVVFQSRDNTKAITVSGNASGVTGTIYARAAQLSESGNALLNAALIVDSLTISGNGVANVVALNSPSGTVAFTPSQIRDAYGINALAQDGTGQTIAIVDAYDDPSIDQALDAFDSQFSLTDSGPSLYAQYGPASSFLTVLNQNGQSTSLPSTDPNGPVTDNWELEEELDVEWAHAIAPGAQIILVEANSQLLSDLMASVATAASQPGVSVVSMSWGFPEGQAVFASDEATYDSVFNMPGVTFVASTGDYGAADPEYPAFSPNVVAVGGTSLTLNADNSYNSETGWGYDSDSAGSLIGSGGGISLYEPEPVYQQGVQTTGSRTTPDVSLVADPATGAWIADPYNLDPSDPFEIVGGTSLSAPVWAGLVALVNQCRVAAGESTLNSSSPTDTQQALYMLPQSDYNTIATGNNGYTANAGYNLVTGLGTPVAHLLVPDLVAYQGTGTIYSGPTVGPLQDATRVNTGTNGGGTIDVFSVLDVIGATGGDLGAVGNGLPAASVAELTATTHGVNRPNPLAEADHDGVSLESLTDVPVTRWMPLDPNAIHDAALAGWTQSRAAAQTPVHTGLGARADPGGPGRTEDAGPPGCRRGLGTRSRSASGRLSRAPMGIKPRTESTRLDRAFPNGFHAEYYDK